MKRILWFMLLLSGCTDEDSARRILLEDGYTNIRIIGYEWLGCGEGDQTHTGFAAIAPSGRSVHGVICCGAWGKACTVRRF